MNSIRKKSFDHADTSIPKMTNSSVDLGDGIHVLKQSAEPGWSWSEFVRPIVGTETCQKRHIGVATSGKLSVTNADGSAVVISAGEAYVIEPGHDAKVSGDEAWGCYEFHPDTAPTYGNS